MSLPDLPKNHPLGRHQYITPVYRVHDGDTFYAEVDLDFYFRGLIAVRIHALWCPELHEPGGKEAREYMRRKISGKQVLIESYKDEDSFRRWVCDVWFRHRTGAWKSLADAAIKAGHGTAERHPPVPPVP